MNFCGKERRRDGGGGTKDDGGGEVGGWEGEFKDVIRMHHLDTRNRVIKYEHVYIVHCTVYKLFSLYSFIIQKKL